MLCSRKRVNLSHGMFSHTVENFEVIAEVPRPLLSAMAVDRLDAQIIFCCVLYVVDIVTTGLV